MTKSSHDPMQYFHDLTCEAGHPLNAADVTGSVPNGPVCACDVRRALAKSVILEAERRHTYPRREITRWVAPWVEPSE